MPLQTGLVSVTFRQLSVPEVIAQVKQANLDGIEWGSDVHVPPGDAQKARETQDRMEEAGLQTFSYGSYYRAGHPKNSEVPFEEIVASASTLGAKNIRVWAGIRGSEESTPETRDQVAQDLLRIAEIAHQAGCTLSLECHGGTLTDSLESTKQLLEEAPHKNLYLYWQPLLGYDDAEKRQWLQATLQKINHLHVFHWSPGKGEIIRHPLREGWKEWKEYLSIVAQTGRQHALLMEFVATDSIEQFQVDAQTLHELVKASQG